MNAASPRLVALIGASAGGLEPLRELVAAMPHDPRMAAIVAQHLAGSEPSALVRLLQAVTRIPVQPIADGMPLRGGLLYVTPPGHHVEIDGRVLRLYAAKSGPAPVPSLDRLFSSAARALGRHALAIVLSGTGQDGAVGARVVREAGGAVWTEQPSEAPFASMPQALIDRGLADHVASAVALGRRLGNWIDGPVAVHGTADMAGERAAFHALVERLGSRSGLDLGQYQEATLRRQFERVMRQHGASSLAQLAQDAQNDPQLVQALLQSLTIGVTEWLRNPSAFNALRLAWREYIRARHAAGATTLRLWSVGCSTGEEVYGLAMLTDDVLAELGYTMDWVVLGSDVSDPALEQARNGAFDEDSVHGLPPAWRERYFTRIGHTLRVQQELRRRCVFAHHDVVQDLPFMRMDLVACRNVLIYFKGQAKDEVLSRLHYALVPDGLLMLGRSEGLSCRVHPWFQAVSVQEHLWRKRSDAGARQPLPGLGRRHPRRGMVAPLPPATPPQLRPVDRLENDLRERLLSYLIGRYAAPTVLVDREGHPLHVVGPMEGLMHWPAGPTAELTLPNLVPAAWRRDVQLAQHRLLITQEAAVRVPLPPIAERPAYVLEAARLDQGQDTYLIVSFGRPPSADTDGSGRPPPAPDEPHGLHEERLQSLIEALEHSQRQLQQVNEALSVTSEELEAANEELEASNEELEASNEELRTLNEELDRSLREQQQLNDLLHAVQESAGTALAVLDHERRLLRYNRPAQDMLVLREAQLGLPWTFDDRHFPWPGELVEHVAKGAPGPWQGQIELAQARYLVQLVPWQTHDARTGYVLSVTDLTELQSAEKARLELQTRLSALTEALHEAVLLFDPRNERLIYASHRYQDWFGPADATPTPPKLGAWIDAIASDERARVIDRWRDGTVPQWTQRYRVQTRDGGWRHLQERASRITASDGETTLIAASLLDVTEMVQLEQRERSAHARLQAVWDNPSVGIAVCDGSGVVIECNGALTLRLGATDAELRGTRWIDWVDVDDRGSMQVQWRSLLSGRSPPPLEQRLHTREGAQRWTRQHLSLARSALGTGDLVVVLLENIEEAKLREQTIFRQANYDALTGLPNRSLYRDRLEQALLRAQRDGHPVYVMFCDLDGFKEVNDVHGHEMGDAVLVETASRIRRTLRPNDTIARFGGDEFVMLIDGAESPLVVERIADTVLQSLRQPFHVGDQTLRLSGSVGIAAHPSDGKTPEELLRMADTAMYAAKNGGRDRMRFYSPQMESRTRRLAEIKAGLEQALTQGQFELHYQPMVTLPQRQVRGAEVLLRWRHPERGLVSPAEFIGVAESSGQIRRIGAWVLRETARAALEAAARWGDDFRLSVNVSATQFGDSALREWLDEHGAALPHLTIEVTESVWMADSPSTLSWLQRVRERGALVALDDFGTGYSSLAYLLRTPVDELKIDKRFTDHVGTGGPSERIVTAVLEIAAALNARVVVEGVETAAQLAFLEPHAPLDVQGFHFARPMPWEAFARFVDASQAANP